MPGICFVTVRATISLAEVLDLVGFEAQEASGDRIRRPVQCIAPCTREACSRRTSNATSTIAFVVGRRGTNWTCTLP